MMHGQRQIKFFTVCVLHQNDTKTLEQKSAYVILTCYKEQSITPWRWRRL